MSPSHSASPFQSNWQSFQHSYSRTSDEALKLFHIQTKFSCHGSSLNHGNFSSQQQKKKPERRKSSSFFGRAMWFPSAADQQKRKQHDELDVPLDPYTLLDIPLTEWKVDGLSKTPMTPKTPQSPAKRAQLHSTKKPKITLPTALQFLFSELASAQNSFILKAEIMDLLYRMITVTFFGANKQGTDKHSSAPPHLLHFRSLIASSAIQPLVDKLIHICFNLKNLKNHGDTILRIRCLKILQSLIELGVPESSLDSSGSLSPEEFPDAEDPFDSVILPSQYIHEKYGSPYLLEHCQEFISGPNFLLTENYLLFFFHYMEWLEKCCPSSILEHSMHQRSSSLDENSELTPTSASSEALRPPQWLIRSLFSLSGSSVNVRSVLTFCLQNFSLLSRFNRISLLDSFYRVFMKREGTRWVQYMPPIPLLRQVFFRYILETDDLAMIGLSLDLFLCEEEEKQMPETDLNESNNAASPPRESLFTSSHDIVNILKQLVFLVVHYDITEYSQLVALGWIANLVTRYQNMEEPASESPKNEVLDYMWDQYCSCDTPKDNRKQSNLLFPQSTDNLQLKHAKSMLFFQVLTCKLDSLLPDATNGSPNDHTAPSLRVDLHEIGHIFLCFADYKYFGEENPSLDRLHDLLCRLIPHRQLHSLIVDVLVENLRNGCNVRRVMDELTYFGENMPPTVKQNILLPLYNHVVGGDLQPFECKDYFHVLLVVDTLVNLGITPIEPMLKQVCKYLWRYVPDGQDKQDEEESKHTVSQIDIGHTVLDIIHLLLTKYDPSCHTQLLHLLTFCEGIEDEEVRQQAIGWREQLNRYVQQDLIHVIGLPTRGINILQQHCTESAEESTAMDIEQQHCTEPADSSKTPPPVGTKSILLCERLDEPLEENIVFHHHGCETVDNPPSVQKSWTDKYPSVDSFDSCVTEAYNDYMREWREATLAHSSLVSIQVPLKISYVPLSEAETSAYSVEVHFEVDESGKKFFDTISPLHIPILRGVHSPSHQEPSLHDSSSEFQSPDQPVSNQGASSSNPGYYVMLHLFAKQAMLTSLTVSATFTTSRRLSHHTTADVTIPILLQKDLLFKDRYLIPNSVVNSNHRESMKKRIFEMLWRQLCKCESLVNGYQSSSNKLAIEPNNGDASPLDEDSKESCSVENLYVLPGGYHILERDGVLRSESYDLLRLWSSVMSQ